MARTATSEEVAAALHVGAATVRKYARQRRVPFDTTPGGHRRYDVREVLEALGVLPPVPPVEDSELVAASETAFVRVPADSRRVDVTVVHVERHPVRPHGTSDEHEAWAEETPLV